MDISIVVPVYNERKNVAILHSRIRDVLDSLGKKYEIIFVDDGSRDGTFQELKRLDKVKIVQFRKNFGQTAAMSAGFKAAKGDIIISMDGDLQNDPQDIPRMLAKMDEGYDVISGWRASRKDSISKVLFSKFAASLRRKFISDIVHDSGCSLKAYKKECFEDLDLYGEMHRYIPALLSWKGFRIGEVKVRHQARRFGTTKYGARRLARGFMDMINVWFWRKYSGRPLHIFGGLGIIFTLIGIVTAIYVAYLKIFRQVDISDTFLSVFAVFLIMIGILLFVSGLMADISIKSYYGSNGRKTYSIKEVIEKK